MNTKNPIHSFDKTLTIRREVPADYAAVEDLVRRAFWNVYRPGCSEHYVLHCLRSDPAFVPELDLVLELKPGYLAGLTGIYHTPQGYFVSDEAVEAFDAAFPPLEKRRLPGQLF